MTVFGDLLLAGISSGAIYAVFALCLTMLFRTSALLNLAVGDFAMLGALGVDFFTRVDHWPLAGAIAFDLVLVGLFAFLYDLAVLRTALEGSRAREAILVVFFFTFSLSLFIEGVSQHLFGTDVHSAPALWSGPALTFWGLYMQRPAVILLALAILTGLGFAGYLRFSLIGKAMVASGDNGFGASIVGVKQTSFRRWMFVAMAVLAAIFGIVESPITGYVFNSGGQLSLLGLIAAAFAGFTKPARAVAAGLTIGIAEAMLGGYVSSQYQDTLLFAVLVAVILFRPQILGAASPMAGDQPAVGGRASRRHRPPVEPRAANGLLASITRRIVNEGGPVTLAVAVTLVVLAALLRLNGNYNDSILVLAVCFAFAILGMVVQIGHSNQLAFHQSVFMMVGAYGVGVLNTKYQVPVIVAVFIMVAGAAVVGMLIGSFATRVSGFALALATLFFSVIASGYVVFAGYFGQATGITSIGSIWSGPSYVSTLERSGAVAVVLLGLCIYGCARILRSGVGLELSLLGENEPMAASLGINTRRRKLEVFVLSAALAALGGGVFAGTQTLVSPSNFDQTAELTLLIMLFVGGRATLIGGLVGTGVIEYLQLGNGFISSHVLLVEGVLFTLILLYAPEGLMGVLRRIVVNLSRATSQRARHRPLSSVGLSVAVAGAGATDGGHAGRLGEARFQPVPGRTTGAPSLPAAAARPTGPAPSAAGKDDITLACRGVTKRFGGVIAVNEVSLTVRGLGVHALCGPNGAGKSTLFELICGGLRADDGEVSLLGRDVTRTPAFARAQLGVARTLQAVRLMNSRSVLDNVAVAAVPSHQTFLTHALFRSDLKVAYERAWETVSQLGLAPVASQSVGELTLEVQRMTELARALVTRPRILLLDEPASGLSASQRGRLAELLVHLGEQMTVVLVEHDLQMVSDIAKEIFVLLDGRLEFQGDASQFANSQLVRTELMGLMANEALEATSEGGTT